MTIKNIVIVGGGTAGWMSAAAFSSFTKAGNANVTLVESEQIGTVGVGEATIPPFVHFNKQLLKIDEADLLARVKGTFKLGIQFVNWGKQGDSYFHPFGNYGYQMAGTDFQHIWMKLRMNGDRRPIHAFSPETMAAMHRKFARTDEKTRGDLPPINYAYHLDAGLYARYLRKYAESRGVKRIEGLVQSVEQHSESGFVTGIKLKSGEVVKGDFFIDCTGFRGLLIEQALKTGYEDWTRWLPCDRAVAVACEQPGDPLPYTRATAHGAGWQWRVPLQHRLGNGHVYCSEYMSDDEATDILMNNLDGKPLTDPKLLRFVTGHRKKFWNKNVVAIGLSAGFMEPLESTSIHLINTAVGKLMSMFTLEGVNKSQEETFNRLTIKEYQKIRDFLILHYNATQRDDTDFWNYCRTMDVPKSLSDKVELYRWSAQVYREDDELFDVTSWVAVMMGQGVFPQTYNPIVDAMDLDKVKDEATEIERSIQFLVGKMPSHGDYLRSYCPAPELAA